MLTRLYFFVACILAVCSMVGSAVALEGCLPTKPQYQDAHGVIHTAFCFGKDTLIGTSDDCGCREGTLCSLDGSCQPICSDGTPVLSCSEEQPLYCTQQGTLISASQRCGCPADKPFSTASGECAYEQLHVSRTARELSGGTEEGLVLSQRGFADLAYGAGVFSTSVSCRSFSGSTSALTDGFGGYAALQQLDPLTTFYDKSCTVDNIAIRPSIEVVLPNITLINQVTFWWGLPYITDYQLDYFDADEGVWRTAYTGHNNFNVDENHYKTSYWNFKGYEYADEKSVKVYMDPAVSKNPLAFEASYNGKKYATIKTTIEFEPILTSKLRLRPLHWQQGAHIYELEAYNTDLHLQLEIRSNTQGNLSHVASGTYLSNIFHTNSSIPSHSYSRLSWGVASKAMDSVVLIKNWARDSDTSVIFFDQDYGNDLGYRYFGKAPYAADSVGDYSSIGYPQVAYNKLCVNDGAWAGQPSPLAGGKVCVAHAAELPWDISSIISDDVMDSANLNHGSARGVANATNDAVSGNAIVLDGVDDYVQFPSSPDLAMGTGDFSISFWVKGTFTTNAVLFSQGDPWVPNQKGYFIWVPHEQMLTFALLNGTQSAWRNDLAVYRPNPNQWNHIVFVVSRTGTSYVYLDGVVVNSINTPYFPNQDLGLNSYSLFLGADNYAGGTAAGFTKGMVDEFMIYKRALSASEVSLINATRAQQYPPNGPSAYWKFDEDGWKPGKGYRNIVWFNYAGTPSISRVVVSELIDRSYRIRIAGTTGSTETVLADINKPVSGKTNVTTVIDFPAIAVKDLSVSLYTYEHPDVHKRSALIWEIATYQTTRTPPTFQRIPESYNISLQFRSGESKEMVLLSPWYGPDGSFNASFTQSGQLIGVIHTSHPWFQYKIHAQTPLTNETPLLDDISVGFQGSTTRPPRALIRAAQSTLVGQLTPFLASSSFSVDSSLVSYHWDFGDGATGEGAAVSHRFEKEGTYYVSLTVTDAKGQSDTTSADILVNIFDCLTPEEESENAQFPISNSIVQRTALDAMQEYAEQQGISIAALDTAEERMNAALAYLGNHMTYLPVNVRESCFTQTLPSLPQLISESPTCGCAGGDFCGMCIDYSIMYTTLVRAMGVNSKCIYSASTAVLNYHSPEQGTTGEFVGHAYNVVLYHNRYRLVEPQSQLSSQFSSSALEWLNVRGYPYYTVGSIFNDAVGDYIQDGNDFSLVSDRIRNYPGSDGLPNATNYCDTTHFQPYREVRQLLGSEWDTATLFEDVCP